MGPVFIQTQSTSRHLYNKEHAGAVIHWCSLCKTDNDQIL